MTSPSSAPGFPVSLSLLVVVARWIDPRRRGTAPGPRSSRPLAQATQARVLLTTGGRRCSTTDFDITRIAVTNPAIADAVVVQPREILIDGKAPGTISLIVWGGDRRVQYDLVVQQPMPALEQQLQQLFPREDIQVGAQRRRHGAVGTRVQHPGDAARGRGGPGVGAEGERHQHADRAGRQRRAAGDAAGAVRRGQPPRAARSSACRSSPERRGFKDWVGRTTTQQFPAPDFEEDELVFSRLPQPVPVQHPITTSAAC